MAAEGALTVAVALRREAFLLRVELTAPPGVTVLLGRSGSGKSTTLDLIAGHLRPDRGRIVGPEGPLFDGAAAIDVPPRRRRVGYVMQQPALFPHRSVLENVGYGLFALPPAERRERIAALVEQLALEPLLPRRPRELSGGERQRVALAQALAPAPALLLLDEPLSALDGAARQGLLGVLQEILRAAPRPVLYVTHDEEEGRLLGQRLLRYRSRAPLPEDGAGLDRVVEVGPAA